MTLKLDASYNAQPYGSLRELNAEGEIKAAVDADLLQAIMKEYLHLLETSAAVYEKNGDYAAGIFSSGWCRQLDQASRSLCDTDSNQEALRCGKWLCHESCWQTSRTSIEAAAPAELRCHGGLRIYAIPIFAGSDVVGSINFGFGSPPKDPEELNSIAVKYAVPEATLVDLANEYHPRSEEVILEAKSRLHRAAKLIGEIVHRNRMEKSLIESLKEKEELILRAHREKEAAEEAKQVAILANKAKSAFLANMSHEIRTPLSAIQGFLELISMEITENPRLLEYIGIVDRNCSYLAQLIDDILDISRVESGNIAIHKEVVNVIALIKEVLAILGEKARSKGLKLSFVPSPRMPKKILSNGIRLRQILINIIGNAVKFTDQGHVEVSCELEFVNQPESRFLTKIKVKDTGRGIADEDRAKLFKPFGQLHAEDSELHEGAGLGLALSRNLAYALGGDITIEQSQKGMGTTFAITVNSGPFDMIEFSEPEQLLIENVETREEVDWKGLKEKRILVVEDNLELQDLISNLLEHYGVIVHKACNGREAISMAMSYSYDALLMDIAMPVLDGYQAIRLLREQGYEKPIVAVTAHAMAEERARLEVSGCDELLTKPVNKRDLLSSIAWHVGH